MFKQVKEEPEELAMIIAESMLQEGVETISVLDLYRMVADSTKYKDEGRLYDIAGVMNSILDGIASPRLLNAIGCDEEKVLTKEKMFPESKGE